MEQLANVDNAEVVCQKLLTALKSLQCPICLETFKKAPKLLQRCGHSFCSCCLQQWMFYGGCVDTGRLKCPLCKTDSGVDFAPFFHLEHDYDDMNDRDYEILCVISYIVDRKISDNKALKKLFKVSSRKMEIKRRIFGRKKPREHAVMEEVQKLTTCPVCKERFDNSRMMPCCMHSVCVQCLKRAYKKSDESFGFVSCPVCFATHRFSGAERQSLHNKDGSVCAEKLCQKEETGLDNAIASIAPTNEQLCDKLPFDYTLKRLIEIIDIDCENGKCKC